MNTDPSSFDEHVAGVRERFDAWAARQFAERTIADLATMLEEGSE